MRSLGISPAPTLYSTAQEDTSLATTGTHRMGLSMATWVRNRTSSVSGSALWDTTSAAWTWIAHVFWFWSYRNRKRFQNIYIDIENTLSSNNIERIYTDNLILTSTCKVVSFTFEKTTTGKLVFCLFILDKRPE